MYCKFCGIETEYSKFKDGTVCCKECSIEKRYIIAEEAKRKREEMNEGLNLEKLLYENSMVQGEMYGGDVESKEGLYVGLAENGLIRVYDKNGNSHYINSNEILFNKYSADNNILCFVFDGFTINEILVLTFFKNQFARYNNNLYYYENKNKKIEIKEINDSDISDRDTPKSFDPVIKPLHYNNTNIETRKVARDITSDKPGDEAGPVFNVIKYISRYNKKNGKQDVEKVAFYTLELLSILLDKEGKSRQEIETYIFDLLDNYKTQFKSDKLSVFK